MKKKSCQASFSDNHLWATGQSFKGQSLLCFLEILCSIAQVGYAGSRWGGKYGGVWDSYHRRTEWWGGGEKQ